MEWVLSGTRRHVSFKIERIAGQPSRKPVINVLVAQDAPLFRGAIAALLSREADIQVVAEVSDRREVVSAACMCRPDVSVLDLAVLRPDRDAGPGVDPIADAINLCRTLPRCRSLIVLDAARSDALRRVDEAVLYSVGFVTRKASPEHLLSAVRSLANGHPVIDPELVLSELTGAANPLTPRERTVLSLAAEGAGAREIATRLFLSAGTVRNCLSRINVKTGARNRVQAIHRARRAGWI